MPLYFALGKISTALNQAPHLNSLVLWNRHHTPQLPTRIRKLSGAPTLGRIQIRDSNHSTADIDEILSDAFAAEPRLRALVTVGSERITNNQSIPSAHLNLPTGSTEHRTSFSYPARLAADSLQEDRIWSRILCLALQPEAPARTFRISSSTGFRVGLLTVCKMFKRLATPYVYRNALLKFETNARSLALQLQRDPDLGRHIRTLAFCFPGYTMPVEFSKIVTYTFRLTELHADTCRPISWDSFTRLGETAGETLRVFRGIEICDIKGVDPGPFCLFSQIREFQWKASTEFITDSSLIPKAAFGLLENLTVDTFYESFLDVLAHMELPHLRTVTFDSDSATGGALFFQKHGAKIQELTISEFQMTDYRLEIWGNCPSLKTLKIHVFCGTMVRVHCSLVYSYIRYATNVVYSSDRLFTLFYRLIQNHPTHIDDLIEELRTTMLVPNMREIEHPLCKWPKNEYQIETSSWARQAEHLLKHHIKLHGPDGVPWRPRLQLAGPGDRRYGQDLDQVPCCQCRAHYIRCYCRGPV
ncbi:hypothetical protein R3P38DRAFT_3522908 [Favolaschia claudopus]|uniref:F-box domain-containing protein n=1 Tax=Favolaschia claudopus TaxID=2862362 RepID=A0AAW0E6N5_9AGAR